MGKVIMSGIVPQLTKPISGILLSDFAEGSIVKINENGSPVDFYVAKHDYESGLNGTGRTLLVRKDCYDARQWHSSNVNAYASSTIDEWLNGDYKSLFDSEVQTAIGLTKFYYTPGNDDTTLNTLKRSVFLLSRTELGESDGGSYGEGTELDIASSLRAAYRNGSAVTQWTRSPYFYNTTSSYFFNANGDSSYVSCSYNAPYSRPCFTIPATSLFDKTTLLFNGVA